MADEYDAGLNNPNNLRAIVSWNPSYTLSRASIGQIMATLSCRPATKQLINKYTDMYMKFDPNTVDYDVRKFNLTCNLPMNVEIDPDNHNIQLGKVTKQLLIEALLQRIDFIATREVPSVYMDEQVQAFKSFQEDILVFKKNILDPSSV